MNASGRLEAEDRAALEQVLSLALGSPEIRRHLCGPDAWFSAETLRSGALAAADAIAAAAADEYATYRRLRSANRRAKRPAEPDTPTGGSGLPAALAVLAPVLSVVAAFIFLLLGYGLRLAESQPHLADTFVGAGWTAAALAGITALVAGVGLTLTVVRHRGASADGPHDDTPAVAEAHAAWRQAVLERGVLPYLHRQLDRSAQPLAHTDGRPSIPGPSTFDPLRDGRTRLGYTSPDFASPDFAGPSTPGRD